MHYWIRKRPKGNPGIMFQDLEPKSLFVVSEIDGGDEGRLLLRLPQAIVIPSDASDAYLKGESVEGLYSEDDIRNVMDMEDYSYHFMCCGKIVYPLIERMAMHFDFKELSL